jgi:hypothetical protein
VPRTGRCRRAGDGLAAHVVQDAARKPRATRRAFTPDTSRAGRHGHRGQTTQASRAGRLPSRTWLRSTREAPAPGPTASGRGLRGTQGSRWTPRSSSGRHGRAGGRRAASSCHAARWAAPSRGQAGRAAAPEPRARPGPGCADVKGN